MSQYPDHDIVMRARGDKYAVTLHLKDSCQCEALGTCWHIIADKFISAIKNARQEVYNLTQLRRNYRKQDKQKTRKKETKTL